MDANKLAKLRAIGYRILDVCGSCIHFSREWGSEWGTCDLYLSTDHLKHTEGRRYLSVHATGTCPEHERRPARLEGFEEFRT